MGKKKCIPLGAQLALAYRASDNKDRCATCGKELPPEPRYCPEHKVFGPWTGEAQEVK